MLPTATVTVLAVTQGQDSGPVTFSPSAVYLVSPIGEKEVVNLSNGLNTIPIPAGTSYIGIAPPQTNTSSLALTDSTGTHTALTLHPVNPSLIAVNYVTAGDLYLLAGGAINAMSIYFI